MRQIPAGNSRFESCNLSSIVLSSHLRRKKADDPFGWEVDWDELGRTVRTVIRFLDDMIEANTYVLPEIERIVRFGNRKIGLGVMGFAHLLYRMGIPYNSSLAVQMADHLGKFIQKEAEAASLELAKKRGVFPNFDMSFYSGTSERYRNATMLTIAPTGTISLFANCSSGIEPVFSLLTTRRTFYEDDRKNRPTKSLTIVDPVFSEVLEAQIASRPLSVTREDVFKHLSKFGHLLGLRGLPKRALGVLALFVQCLAALLVVEMFAFEHFSLGMFEHRLHESYFGGALVVDPWALFFQGVFLLVSILVTIASLSDLGPKEPHQGEYYSLLLLATVGMMIVAAADDLFVLFIGVEMTSVSTFALVAWRKTNRLNTEAAVKFFLIGGLSAALFLYGISWIYGATGSVGIHAIAAAAADAPKLPALSIGVALLTAGLGFKLAAVPFHAWTKVTLRLPGGRKSLSSS